MQNTDDGSVSFSDRDLSDTITVLAPLENAYTMIAAAYQQRWNPNKDTDIDGNTDTMLPSQHIEQMNWDLSAVDAVADSLSKAAAALENAVNDIADARKTAMAQWKGDAAEEADKDFGKISKLCSDQLPQVKGMDTALTGQSGSVVATLKSMGSKIYSEASSLAGQCQADVSAIYQAGDAQQTQVGTPLDVAQKHVYQAISTMKNFIWSQLDGLSGTAHQVSAYEKTLVSWS
ncbi:MAG TPA: hypothetical protein VFW65_22730 [Pseudonocardiaceae bacterium]|nr:hypothetical protein [Pseudonocardiaceae bacterium]